MVGLRIAATLQLIDLGPGATMAGNPTQPPNPGSATLPAAGCRGLCCPHCVLEISHDVSCDTARQAAEDAVRRLADIPGSEWILAMKLTAFAAIAREQVGAEKAHELFQDVHPRKAPFNIFREREPRPFPPPPPPPPRRVKDAPPESEPLLAANSAPKGSSTKGLVQLPKEAASGAGAAASSSSGSLRPVKEEPKQEGITAQAETENSSEKPPQEGYHWQVRKGRKGKMRWGWVDEDLDRHLERKFQEGVGETTFLIDGWKYYYDLLAMTQTSPGDDATERAIRRVRSDDAA